MEKKENIIKYREIETNNLKKIDIDIGKNKIIGIAGPSGSGKSSLAYDTIYNISEVEEAKLKKDLEGIQRFKIGSYENIIPAVEIRQTNNNSNPRSTIATYLGLDNEFKKVFVKINNIPPILFTFNNPINACEKCQGLGYIYKLDSSKIINEEKSIKEGAIIPWHNSTLGYEEKLLIKFAEDNGISITTKIKELSEKERELIFYGKGEVKYRISYKAYGKQRNKSFTYSGILLESNELLEDISQPSSKQKIDKYIYQVECPYCKGKRFNDKVLKYKVFEKSIGDYYTEEVEEIYRYLSEKLGENSKIDIELKNILKVLEKIVKAKLGYLNLNRSIPSLSGGELQRLRLISIMNSQITNMMYIIDEPSSKLHVSEYEGIYKNFQEIKERGNTVIYVEHNPYFLKRADELIFIGPGAGEKGGKIVKNYIKELKFPEFESKERKNFIKITDININNIKNLDVEIPLNSVIGIYGVSGSGKSSLVKYLNKKLEKSEYLTQKPLKGNINSTIGTYSGTLFADIREELGRKYNIDADTLHFTSKEGRCPRCEGKGIIKYDNSFSKEIDVLCDTCQGQRYSQKVLEKKLIHDKNIYEILTTTIDILIEKNFFTSKKIVEKLELLKKLGLGHLNLFRPTNTLSGGEAQRVKLSDILGKKVKGKVLFFDEPLSGLSDRDAIEILNIFREMADQGATIIFIEHNTLAIDACDYILEMGPGKGKNGGKIIFFGTLEEFKQSENYKIYIKK